MKSKTSSSSRRSRGTSVSDRTIVIEPNNPLLIPLLPTGDTARILIAFDLPAEQADAQIDLWSFVELVRERAPERATALVRSALKPRLPHYSGDLVLTHTTDESKEACAA